MKAEAVANGAQAGRNPEEGEPLPDTGALTGPEPKDPAPKPDAPAGREPKSTAPESATDTPTRTLTKREVTAPAPEAEGPAGLKPKDSSPEPENDTPVGAPAGRGATVREPDADAPAGREPKNATPEPATDTPTRTLTKRGATAPQPEADAPAGREPKNAAKPGADGPAAPAGPRGASGAPAGTSTVRGAQDADTGSEGGARAGQESADAPAGREADDAESETGTPAGREPVRASDGGESPEGGAPEGREAARPPAGSGPDPEADTATGREPESGRRPGQKADPGTGAAAGSGSGARETPDAAADRSDGPAEDASPQAGKDRPRPSWAKGDAPGGDREPDPADGTSARSGGRAGAEGHPRPSWAKALDEEGTPEDKGAPGPRTRAGAGIPGGAANPGKGAAAQPHDPERTSEFVALKDPDAVRPAKPQPTPTPAQRPAPAVLEPTREAPLPPLELLAELTNTAPPPETTRRTLTRRVKVWTPIVLLLGAAVAGAQMLRPLPAPQFVTTQTSHTIEGSTTIPWPAKGQAAVRFPGSGAISTFGEQKPVPTASVGKVMTAYVILKNHPLRKGEPGPGIEIDAKAVAEGKSEDESRIKDLTLGQKFSEQDMLKMMMIPSANNIARQLARWDSGNNEAAFVAKMNAAAQELGMRDTTYTDPSGLDAGTVSTAADQLKLAEAVMREEAFRDIVELASSPVKGRTQAIDNNNTLLSVRGLDAVGIKTGSSTPAGGTLMWAADKKFGGESPLILGVMMEQRVDGPDPNAAKSLELVLNNSRKIIEAVRKALAPATVIRKGQLVGHVSDGLGGSTPLVAAKDLTVIGVPGQQLRLSLGAGAKPLPHEAKAGTEVGVLTVGEGIGAKTVPVAVGTDLAEPSFGARVTRLS